jgi:methionyl-tRNA formyltransferase
VVDVEPRGIVVQTGDGLLILTELQAPGKKRISGLEFANSRSMHQTVLGR